MALAPPPSRTAAEDTQDQIRTALGAKKAEVRRPPSLETHTPP